MSSIISNIFSLLQSCLDVVMINPLLSLLIGINIAALLFALLSGLFVRRRG